MFSSLVPNSLSLKLFLSIIGTLLAMILAHIVTNFTDNVGDSLFDFFLAIAGIWYTGMGNLWNHIHYLLLKNRIDSREALLIFYFSWAICIFNILASFSTIVPLWLENYEIWIWIYSSIITINTIVSMILLYFVSKWEGSYFSWIERYLRRPPDGKIGKNYKLPDLSLPESREKIKELAEYIIMKGIGRVTSYYADTIVMDRLGAFGLYPENALDLFVLFGKLRPEVIEYSEVVIVPMSKIIGPILHERRILDKKLGLDKWVEKVQELLDDEIKKALQRDPGAGKLELVEGF